MKKISKFNSIILSLPQKEDELKNEGNPNNQNDQLNIDNPNNEDNSLNLPFVRLSDTAKAYEIVSPPLCIFGPPTFPDPRYCP